MGKAKSLKDKLYGAAVMKMSFRLRGDAEPRSSERRCTKESPAFKVVYPGVLRDLELEDAAVEKYIQENRESVERAARGSIPAQAPRG